MSGTPNASYKAYNRATHTVAKTRQVVMLYDGIIRFLQQAKEAMEQKAIEQRYHKLTRASEIISGLQSCLDFDTGGKTAHVLHSFYTSIELRIITLHRTANPADCQTIIDEMKQMRDVWQKIDHGEAAASAPATTAAPAVPAAASPAKPEEKPGSNPVIVSA